jgi:hypothetical protein
MRSDPRFWPQLFERDRPVSVLIKKIVDGSPRPVTRRDVERKFQKYRRVPSTGLAQELKELANRGEIDRLKLGVYWRRGTASAAYESDIQRMYRLVYSAPDHRMREAELAVALGLSRGDAASRVSILRKRGLFAPATGNGVVVASAESLATLQRGPIFDGRGGIFYSASKVIACAEDVTFTTLHPERPRIDPGVLGEKIVWLKTLKSKQRKDAVAATAKELGMDAVALEVSVLSKSELRAARKDAAKEQWRAEVTPLMQKFPERSPLPLPKLFKEVSSRIVGLTRETFKEVLREQKVWLEQNGLNTSWGAAGAPPRG